MGTATRMLSALLLLTACAAPGRGQRADLEFALPGTGPAAFALGAGPRVVVDEAHHNFHTAGGRYAAFAALLRRDGYRVEPSVMQFSAAALDDVDVLVVANALGEVNVSNWSRPVASAFSPAEVAAVETWVRGGGRLLLVADHMPMPGAAAELAAAFGVRFHDGYAFGSKARGPLTFRPGAGLAEAAGVPHVTTFTGQAFDLEPGVAATPLLTFSEGAYQLFPDRAGRLDEATPRADAAGLHQGALLRHGRGRVAVFGEAAAFTAQRSGDRPMGMNHPSATHNARFALNVLAWLVER